jgi:hypothetical protein
LGISRHFQKLAQAVHGLGMSSPYGRILATNINLKINDTNMNRRTIETAIVTAGAALLLASPAVAAEKISFTGALDYNTHFMSYGVNVWGAETDETFDGGTFNPSASVSVDLGEGWSFYTGVWADVNDYASSSIGDKFQEVDVWAGLAYSFDSWKVDVAFQQWYYAGETEGIVDLTISYDTLLSPYLRLHNRVEGVGGQLKGTIAELGGTLYSGEFEGISLSVPLALGFAVDDFHVADETGFVYAKVGAAMSYPLPVSEDYGAWAFNASVNYWHTDEDLTGNATGEGYLTMGAGVSVSF